MKAQLQHLSFDQLSEAVQCFWVIVPNFGFHWHYHPELEITYVQSGQGTRLVGDHVDSFEAGDFVFLGSNLPHTWISSDSCEGMEVLVLQCAPSLFAAEQLGFSELHNLQRLFRKADRGLAFSPTQRDHAVKLLLRLSKAQGFSRYLCLLELFDYLGSLPDATQLASPSYSPILNEADEKRILSVCRYIHDHFTENIKLDEVAQLAFMNSTSFCRFFRKMTGQTLFEYITDLRLNKACHLLLEDHKRNISEIAELTGFNSQTLFNRSFARKRGMTPREFRKIRRGE